MLAHAVAFGSAYVLSATSASFLLVLAVHHEVQYLYFTYAMARWPMAAHKQENPKIGNRQSKIRFAASFALWPLIGLAGALGSSWCRLEWFVPLELADYFGSMGRNVMEIGRVMRKNLPALSGLDAMKKLFKGVL